MIRQPEITVKTNIQSIPERNGKIYWKIRKKNNSYLPIIATFPLFSIDKVIFSIFTKMM